jgi:hypothetical protein
MEISVFSNNIFEFTHVTYVRHHAFHTLSHMHVIQKQSEEDVKQSMKVSRDVTHKKGGSADPP